MKSVTTNARSTTTERVRKTICVAELSAVSVMRCASGMRLGGIPDCAAVCYGLLISAKKRFTVKRF